MPLAKIFKENFVLAVGLIVPVAVMIVFLVISTMPSSLFMSTPPKFDVLFYKEGYTGLNLPIQSSLSVENGILYVQYAKSPQGSGYYMPRIYLYEAATNKVKQLSLVSPQLSDDSSFGKKIPVDAAKGMKLDTSLTAPDGYEFAYADNYNHGGLINDLFIGGAYGYRQHVRLKKGNGSIAVPPVDDAAYGQVSFLGWVVGQN
jgi:hypothetical protein